MNGVLLFFKSQFESLEKLSAKDNTQYMDGQKELGSARDPSPMIWREPSGRNHTMDMGMMQHGLAPGMENRHKADLSAETLGIGGDLE